MKLFLTALALLSLPAFATDALKGKFTDGHGSRHTIDAKTWAMSGSGKPSRFHILESGRTHILARNDAANPFHPNLYSRFDFVKQKDGSVAFCQTVADAKDQELTAKARPADYKAKDGKGCAGFPFSVLKPHVAAKTASPAEEGGAASGE